MTIIVLHHVVYILISVSLTIWVGQTLSKNGRVFLVDALKGNETVIDSINHLLVVGFYLINFGIVSLFLRYGDKPTNIVDFIELMSIKVGVVFLLLGLMHFINLFIFKVSGVAARLRNSGPVGRAAPEAGSRFFSAAAK
jgi:hypothetical protein